ncbi:DUF6402 family protein, partial [Helicobacter sp. CaF467b]|uniref:DUF6402 family protein n=2 Tax=Campylobacterales TaxID=213849 RepID=UPI001F59DAA8
MNIPSDFIVDYDPHNPNPHLSDSVKTHIIQNLFHQQRLCKNNPNENCLDDTGIKNTRETLKDYSKLSNIADTEEIDLIVHTENIKNAKTKTELTFSIYPKDKFLSIHDDYKRINTLRPYDIDKAAIQQGIGIGDEDFIREVLPFNKQAQAIALYACTGKFSIYYIPSKFLLKKENDKTYVYIKELYAYIYDTFDFDDEGHKYYDDKEHNDENIEALGQPVGTWDYKEMRFDFEHSGMQIGQYLLSGFSKNRLDKTIKMLDIPTLKQKQTYPLYNQDYQDYKRTFNKGLNFRVFSRKDKEHSNLNASQSIATLHALLENQQVQCLHGGVVILKSHKGKTFKD